MAENKSIKVKIRDTENTLFEGLVDRISSFNEVGPFDIYPMHANFISILRQGLSLYNKKNKLKEIGFEQAVLKVKKDEVHIFLGIEALMIEDEESKDQETPRQKKQKK
jgi:F0F1-type ATP synthase epsilon subunit